jgi:hypothetical protein
MSGRMKFIDAILNIMKARLKPTEYAKLSIKPTL